MLKLRNLTLRRGARVLFSDADFTVHGGQKVGIAGANGSGKSSLLALVRGELESDLGEIVRPRGVIAHVAQETPATARTAIEYVIDGDEELRAVEAELARAAADGDGTREARLHMRMADIDGYSARSRAARLMRGLGFTADQEEARVDALSGGWRVRLNLARALMCRSDLLLLDEPTNHLDLDAVLWLEEWLRAYPGTLLVISHDRDFLDQVVQHILHIEQGKVTMYAGSYSDFELRRAERLAAQQAAYERQQREVARMRAFVDRFRAKATKARQAQSRLRVLARMEMIAAAHVDTPFSFALRAPEGVPNPLLRLEGVVAGYGNRVVLHEVGLLLAPGDRIGLLGPNGAGKSTLIKVLAGELAPLAGSRVAAAGTRIGYFAQHQLEQLRADDSPLDHLRRLDPAASEQSLRDYLGSFGFGGDFALAPVAPFSGGEKARLVLALLIYQRPNLLLLDEPTNHLDLDMRHALTVALQDFDGAMLIVSHDRHLLRGCCDRLLRVAADGVQVFDGDLDDYARWLAQQRGAADAGGRDAVPAHSAASRREQRRQDADRRRQLQPLRARMQALEKKLEELRVRKTDVERRLADPELYGEARKPMLKELLLEQAQIDQAVAEAEDAWLAAGEELEAAENGADGAA